MTPGEEEVDILHYHKKKKKIAITPPVSKSKLVHRANTHCLKGKPGFFEEGSSNITRSLHQKYNLNPSPKEFVAIRHSNLSWRKRNAKTFSGLLKIQSLSWHWNQWICNANMVRSGTYKNQVINRVLAQISGPMVIFPDSHVNNWDGYT